MRDSTYFFDGEISRAQSGKRLTNVDSGVQDLIVRIAYPSVRRNTLPANFIHDAAAVATHPFVRSFEFFAVNWDKKMVCSLNAFGFDEEKR